MRMWAFRFALLLWLPFAITLSGCAGKDRTTFARTHQRIEKLDKDGKKTGEIVEEPVVVARVAKNIKIPAIQKVKKQDGTTEERAIEIDAGGWGLIHPDAFEGGK